MYYEDIKYPLIRRGLEVPNSLSDYINALMLRQSLEHEEIEQIRSEMKHVFTDAALEIPHDFDRNFNLWFLLDVGDDDTPQTSPHDDPVEREQEASETPHEITADTPIATVDAESMARRFLETQIVVETDNFLICSDIYTAYQQFVETEEHTENRILTDQKLYKLIREQFNVSRTRRRRHGELKYGFTGIRVTTDTRTQDTWKPGALRLLREWRTQDPPVSLVDIAHRLEMPVEVIDEYCKKEGLVCDDS